jgi:citrate lyase subunit beta/citryl-CoA lyase
VPGHEEKKIRKAYTLNPDLIVIDLEATVPDQEKENAKKIIQTCDVNKENTYIRINSNDDLSFVCDEKFIGIFLPFTESKEQLLSIDSLLKKNEKFKTDIIPIIESQKGLDNLKEICNFVERVKIISFGSHDLAKSINLKVSDNENEILEFRKLIAKFSKNPIDTSYLNFKDIDGFKRSCKIVKDLGFGGKACIHPNQIEISNEIFNEK